ncbi:hypothetical protein [Actinoplanes sp. NBRC 103695]|uniref:hypothetical protein n=1 Tax=Actinoplanes sp. NBRC 103695 TaxID=3032202 RepID=UPI0024A22352|nr:hypothetical protein [Actinoplanes sp. NBRC 103695]GLY92843.1 hypothetical protein Acsp02_00990 [Actinoplanes sp. NBRC 103695]
MRESNEGGPSQPGLEPGQRADRDAGLATSAEVMIVARLLAGQRSMWAGVGVMVLLFAFVVARVPADGRRVDRERG